MREDVVRVQYVRAAPVGGEPRRQRKAEELGERRDAALLDRDLGDVLRGLDAEHGDARLLVVLQEVAVVARDLHGEGIGAEPRARLEAADEVTRVREHRVGERREVEVVAEELLRRHRLRDLDERAVWAEDKVERVALLVCLRGIAHERVRERRRAEGQHRFEVGAVARAAGCLQCHGYF